MVISPGTMRTYSGAVSLGVVRLIRRYSLGERPTILRNWRPAKSGSPQPTSAAMTAIGASVVRNSSTIRCTRSIVRYAMGDFCQRPVGIAHWRPVEVPAGGQQICPFAARSSAHRWWWTWPRRGSAVSSSGSPPSRRGLARGARSRRWSGRGGRDAAAGRRSRWRGSWA